MINNHNKTTGLMRFLRLVFLISPYFLTAQCTATKQTILSDTEGFLIDSEGFLTNENATTYNVACIFTKAILSPNPCFDNFEIKDLNKSYTEGSIFGIDGRFCFSVNVQSEIDVSSLSRGVYLIAIKHSNLVFKFTKQ